MRLIQYRSTTFVVGVDIPSGISADTGRMLGTAVRCDMTVTFEYTKYGMLLSEGREYSGDIICKSIGLYVPEDIKKMAEVLGDEGVFSISKAEMTGDSRITQSGQGRESRRRLKIYTFVMNMRMRRWHVSSLPERAIRTKVPMVRSS